MRKRNILLYSSIAVFLALSGTSWHVGTYLADTDTKTMLEDCGKVYVRAIDEMVDVLLEHSITVVAKTIGNTARAVPKEELRELAQSDGLGEISIVDRNGICIATTIDNGEGWNFHDNPKAAEFLKLLGGASYLTQTFRYSIDDPTDFSKFFGIPFPDGSGFIQIGIKYSTFREMLKKFGDATFNNWSIGRTGYLLFDFPELKGRPADRVYRAVSRGKPVHVRPFVYAGETIYAVLPDEEYYAARNVHYWMVTLVSAVLVFVFAFLIRKFSLIAARERRSRMLLDERRAQDLLLARRIQMSVLPSARTFRKDLLRMSFSAKSVPAKEVGGDFYDFAYVDEQRIAFIIADVSGKGIAAAMFAMEARNLLRDALQSESDLAMVFNHANQMLCGINEFEMFVTAWGGILDITTGEIEYVNAGHNRPVFRRADGNVFSVDGKGGMILGLFPNITYRVNRLKLTPGDALFLYTDGITEAMNRKDKLFGEKRLHEVIAASEKLPSVMQKAVEAAVREFSDGREQTDDITSMAIVWHGLPVRKEQTFQSAETALTPAMDWLRSVVELHDRKAISRLLNASDEIMTNIIKFSGSEKFTIGVENAPARTRVTFTDNGRKYDPLSHDDPDVHIDLQDRPVGGLGILMTKSLVDSVAYSRENGQNILAIVKLES